MRLIITLRPDPERDARAIKVTTDYKYESRDTPTINNYGLSILKAFTDGCHALDNPPHPANKE